MSPNHIWHCYRVPAVLAIAIVVAAAMGTMVIVGS
jgi:hypothetical protein